MVFNILLVLFLITLCSKNATSESCLGIAGACDLSLDEITLPGAHNAGAGFDGLLMYHKFISIPALSCPYRSQHASAYDMLNAGIRYFDIDLCYEHSSKYGAGLWTCHSGAYGGKMLKFFDQVDKWMNEPKNRKEIVVFHFNRDYQKGEEENIKRALTKELKARWNPSSKNGKLAMQSAWWVKLRVAIKSNQRIYAFVHNNIRDLNERFLFHAGYVGYTWKPMAYVGSDNCKNLANDISVICKTKTEKKYSFIRLDLVLTWGLCNDDLAYKCNQYIGYATDKCYKEIRKVKKRYANTVNFIVTDYSTRYPGTNAVKVAREMTLKYIKDKSQS